MNLKGILLKIVSIEMFYSYNFNIITIHLFIFHYRNYDQQILNLFYFIPKTEASNIHLVVCCFSLISTKKSFP